MKRKWISCLLALSLLLTLTPGLTVQALDETVQVKQIVAATVEFFTNHEGDYGTIFANDSGAASIGKLQWHGVRALRLLRRITAMNPAQAQTLLGSSLYSEVISASESSWKRRTLSSSEASRVSALLVTPEGILAQDETAFEDISGYIENGYDMGIRTDEALMYYCDIENQYGSGNGPAVVRAAKKVLGKETISSLDEFHNALLNSPSSLVQNYISRRKKTYSFIKNLDWNDYIDCPDCPGAAFYDMPAASNWMHKGIEFVLEEGLFSGVAEHYFAAELPMTRAMMVTVLYRLEGTPPVTGEDVYEDVPAESWYTDAVIWATTEGVVSGVGEALFAPDEIVSREQIATLLYRFSQRGMRIVQELTLSTLYPDAEDVSDFAVQSLAWATENELISGERNQGITVLNPQGAASRGQVASILMRFYALNCQ